MVYFLQFFWSTPNILKSICNIILLNILRKHFTFPKQYLHQKNFSYISTGEKYMMSQPCLMLILPEWKMCWRILETTLLISLNTFVFTVLLCTILSMYALSLQIDRSICVGQDCLLEGLQLLGHWNRAGHTVGVNKYLIDWSVRLQTWVRI